MKKTSVEMSCRHCKKSFNRQQHRIKNGTGHYCGQVCYLANRWREGGKCKECKKKCANRFCSTPCQKLYWSKNSHLVHKHSRHWERKIALIESLGAKCVKCGFSDYRALDIDHIDPTTKMRPEDGSYNWTRRFKDWAANTGNLRLLCANCHRLHTWESRGFGPRSTVAAALK